MDIKDVFKDRLAPQARLLGLDVGTKTVGLALSDVLRTIATPLETIRRTKFQADARRLAEICRDHQVGGLVLGLPVSMDGTQGPKCQSVRQFAQNLLDAWAGTDLAGLPMAFWDERLSTAAVERVLIGAADMTRARRKAVVDKMAAAYILQGALDALARP
ncbi:MAG: Holliday junction resolvase RuvX [Rhodobacterales bacterium]|nr:Holliday junction resolvase RuvX [Rhodobacterales bacterium]